MPRAGDELRSDRGESYTLMSPRDKGGQAEVWAARDAGRVTRAIKIAGSGGNERLRREAEVLAGFVARPELLDRVVELVDHGHVEVDGEWRLFLVLHFYPDTLEAWVKGRAPLRVMEACEKASAAVEVVQAAFPNLVHRDLKPSNFLVEWPFVVISDYGMVKDTQASTTSEGGSTVAFAPPEQRANPSRNPNAAWDQWALGATISACLLGQVPEDLLTENRLSASTRERLSWVFQDEILGRPGPGGEQLTLAVESLLDTLARALDPDPLRRGRSGELRAASQRVVEALERPRPLSLPSGPPRRNGRDTVGGTPDPVPQKAEPRPRARQVVLHKRPAPAPGQGAVPGLPVHVPVPPRPLVAPARVAEPPLARPLAPVEPAKEPPSTVLDVPQNEARRARALWVAVLGFVGLAGVMGLVAYLSHREEGASAPSPVPSGTPKAEVVESAPTGNPAGIDWVKIPGQSYEMSRTEVTVAQYGACVSARVCEAPTRCDWGEPNWGKSGREQHPVNCVSWDMAGTFAKWAGGRLPTEAEWEYAAKGGQSHEYSGSSNVDEVAWYDKNSEGGTHPVELKKANGYGLHDMSGNVWEWCEDAAGSSRVLRGGSWDSEAWVVRVASRSGYAPGIRFSSGGLGFRLSRSGS